ncbi:MAG: DUF6174 domain-containing protein [Polyangiaceae bacterium]
MKGFVIVACSLLFAACGGTDIGAKRAEWLERAPDRYVVGVCPTGFSGSPCRVVAVDHGVVVAAESRVSEDQPWEPLVDAAEPIEALFSSAEHVGDSCDLRIEFDATYSYPTKTYFDCGEEGWGEQVMCFTADSVDLAACRDKTVR